MKTIKDLNNKELLEDLAHYTQLTQVKCPSFTNADFVIIWKYIKELQLRDKGRFLIILDRIADALEGIENGGR